MPSAALPRAPSTKRRMFWMLLATIVVIGGVFGVKKMMDAGMNQFFDNMPQPPSTITATEARLQDWADTQEAVGTLVAVNGTDVTTEAGGVVSKIHFSGGENVRKGAVLVELNTSNEMATLRALEAAAKLAVLQRDRWQQLSAQKLVSRADVDQRASDAAAALAQVEAQRALIAQKTLRAPFDGTLGIRKINLGQYLQPGNPVVSLQSLDPIHLNFTLPEQRLGQIGEGTIVTVTVDNTPGRHFEGRITAIEPSVDASTRNFTAQATLRNDDRSLRPGGFARVRFEMGGSKQVVVIPQTAISYNPYGNSVYVVGEAPKQANAGKDAPQPAMPGAAPGPQLVVSQRFVKTGATRGDLIAVLEGLKPGERIASSGLLKLRNGVSVIVDNTVPPNADAQPAVANQ